MNDSTDQDADFTPPAPSTHRADTSMKRKNALTALALIGFFVTFIVLTNVLPKLLSAP